MNCRNEERKPSENGEAPNGNHLDPQEIVLGLGLGLVIITVIIHICICGW